MTGVWGAPIMLRPVVKIERRGILERQLIRSGCPNSGNSLLLRTTYSLSATLYVFWGFRASHFCFCALNTLAPLTSPVNGFIVQARPEALSKGERLPFLWRIP